MKLKIKRTKLTRGNLKLLRGEIGDTADPFAFLAESACRFFQTPSLNAIDPRKVPSIRKDLLNARNALETLKNRPDALHNMHLAYRQEYKTPPSDRTKEDLGFVGNQTAETTVYRPSPTIVPDDGWKHYQKAAEVGIFEMLERLLHSLEIAEANVEGAPHRKRGTKSLSWNDKVFIRLMAAHYEAVMKKASYTTDGPFHRVLCIVTRNAGNMTYTGSHLRTALTQ